MPMLRHASWETGALSTKRTIEPLTAPPGATSTSVGMLLDATWNQFAGQPSRSTLSSVVVPCRCIGPPLSFRTSYGSVASVPGYNSSLAGPTVTFHGTDPSAAIAMPPAPSAVTVAATPNVTAQVPTLPPTALASPPSPSLNCVPPTQRSPERHEE